MRTALLTLSFSALAVAGVMAMTAEPKAEPVLNVTLEIVDAPLN